MVNLSSTAYMAERKQKCDRQATGLQDGSNVQLMPERKYVVMLTGIALVSSGSLLMPERKYVDV